MNIHIGTSGWSYPSGRGTWNGIFYPAKRTARRTAARRSSQFDELSYYAEHFDTVEVNSTFYRPPSPQVSASWIRRTPAHFEFSLKLYQKFTHPKMFKASTGRSDVEVDRDDIDLFLAGLEPIVTAGRLGALLAQFPPSFKREPASEEYLGRLLGAFHSCPVAVELRHRSWSDAVGATLGLLNEFGAAWVQIDEPKFRFSIQQNALPNVTGFYYMRLHGRNADTWWTHRAAEDRYDYLYTSRELRPFAETAKAADRLVKKLFLYMNNHFAAKAVANATVLKHQLEMPITGAYPAEFVERYPEVRDLVHVSGTPSLPVLTDP